MFRPCPIAIWDLRKIRKHPDPPAPFPTLSCRRLFESEFVDSTSATMYTTSMRDIVVRAFPEELVRRAKAVAALDGLYFNEWVRLAVDEKLPGNSVPGAFGKSSAL
jgi:hypothetical protein